MARQTAANLGDTIAALEAAGALSPLSPTPGQLATVCERLGIGRHRITARPTADLPEPWLSVLACYGRRHRSAVRDGVATTRCHCPRLDGARIALGGLHSVDDQSYLHVFGCGLPPAWTSRRFGPEARPAFGWWLRDDAGHWHAAVPSGVDGRRPRGDVDHAARAAAAGPRDKLRHALHHPAGQPGQCPSATVLVGVAMTGLPGGRPGPPRPPRPPGPGGAPSPRSRRGSRAERPCTRSAGKMAASACPPIPTSKASSSSRPWAARKRRAWTWPRRGGGTPTTSAVLALGPRGPADDVDVTWDDVEEFRSGSPNTYRWPSSGTMAARVVPRSQPMRSARRADRQPGPAAGRHPAVQDRGTATPVARSGPPGPGRLARRTGTDPGAAAGHPAPVRPGTRVPDAAVRDGRGQLGRRRRPRRRAAGAPPRPGGRADRAARCSRRPSGSASTRIRWTHGCTRAPAGAAWS